MGLMKSPRTCMGNDYNETQAIKQAFDGPKPTVCRIVLFTPRKGAGVGDPMPGVVTAVYGQRDTVNLTVLPDGGLPYPVSSIRRGKPGEGNTWHWPPRA